MRNLVHVLLNTLFALIGSMAFSQTHLVPTDADLQSYIERSMEGDTLLLSAGTYAGRLTINKPLTIDGQNHSTIDALGHGDAITILSHQVTVKNVKLRNWGDDLTQTNAAIKIKNVENIAIQSNQMQGDGFGIYLENTTRSQITGNQVIGNASMRSADRGNGIHLTNVSGIDVANNDVRTTRDGLYIINSTNNQLRNNQMQNLRFGIHYMYSYDNVIRNNQAMNVDVGYALMSSNNLTVVDNTAIDCADYGLLLNFVNYSTFDHNQIDRIRSPFQPPVTGDEGKALFVYNSNHNTFLNNRFAHSDMGIHLTAGSEGNQLSLNQFINNEVQVKYVSSRTQEWSVNGQGNFWSNYAGWDLNNDTIGDTAFEPNDDIDKLLWKYPEAKVLMDSPAVLLLRWVQRSFPILKSPGVKDSFPMYQIQESLND